MTDQRNKIIAGGCLILIILAMCAWVEYVHVFKPTQSSPVRITPTPTVNPVILIKRNELSKIDTDLQELKRIEREKMSILTEMERCHADNYESCPESYITEMTMRNYDLNMELIQYAPETSVR